MSDTIYIVTTEWSALTYILDGFATDVAGIEKLMRQHCKASARETVTIEVDLAGRTIVVTRTCAGAVWGVKYYIREFEQVV
jgi:hypothetical protein